MFTKLLNIFSDSNEKIIDQLQTKIDLINSFEDSLINLTNEELTNKTEYFRNKLSDNISLDEIMPEAFAVVREASKRILGQRHYDVQIMGGIVLYQGSISEMKTGEGKTLTATLPLYLNALEGGSVHLVTVNDYLSRRDCSWMGPVFNFLGISVACLQYNGKAFIYNENFDAQNKSSQQLIESSRKDAYLADITYGTNNEFGFDYLRDNMVIQSGQLSQRSRNFAIVDEVDNILIDEARTPLIISGPSQQPTDLYKKVNQAVKQLQIQEDFEISEKERTALLTEDGISKLETLLNVENMYSQENYLLAHYVENSLKAHYIFAKDVDYVLSNGEVVIVDEFTGRLMPGRRYSEGLHQSLEAKEQVRIQQESITYATITLQNYFRLYNKLSGMTGTAATEAEEFFKIYKLESVSIPTHKPMLREDLNDLIFLNESYKFNAVVEHINKLYNTKRPVLIGTGSIEKSEQLSLLLKKQRIPHQILNAKQHEKEATIVAQAGRLGSVTVSTNMAGRGTDIVLGGNPEDRDSNEWQKEHDKVIELGGLYIIGTERHEARRIDNQLRGRSGRQGDPGTTQFYVSLQDDQMRRFGGERIQGIMNKVGMDDKPVTNSWVTRAINQTQIKMEGHNFDIRKHLVEYDDVMNIQRSIIYEKRMNILSNNSLKIILEEMFTKELENIVDTLYEEQSYNNSNNSILSILVEIEKILPEFQDFIPSDVDNPDQIITIGLEYFEKLYTEQFIENQNFIELQTGFMLRVIDSVWVEHLTTMQNLRESIGLQAYGQRDPLVMYKRESRNLFDAIINKIGQGIAQNIFNVSKIANLKGYKSQPKISQQNSNQIGSVNSHTRIGRNDPCTCGSGKKYKRCHGS